MVKCKKNRNNNLLYDNKSCFFDMMYACGFRYYNNLIVYVNSHNQKFMLITFYSYRVIQNTLNN